jgi:hypothetical protein
MRVAESLQPGRQEQRTGDPDRDAVDEITPGDGAVHA